MHGVDRQDRADRILDAARELLLSWGYRRVTIDELSRRAGVGKGTIYLHWRSREDIFHAVSAREAATMADAIVDAVRADPTEVALHRYHRRLFVEAMQRPVLRALYTRDADTLGSFLAAPHHQQLEESKLGVTRDYLARARVGIDVEVRSAVERSRLHTAHHRVRILCGGTVSVADPRSDVRAQGRPACRDDPTSVRAGRAAE